MKVVALISGGKDSCYAMMACVAAGHEIVALANLQPEGKDELDSYMFQTVGHEGVSLYAQAMDVPLYRAPTLGQSKSRTMEYCPSIGDEVEDLYQLVKRVREEVGVEGVSSGAVLSDYQRLRVENICSRLGLVSLAYLWRREQGELLREMVEAGVRAVVIKVAAMGLTSGDLGRTVEELHPRFLELNEKYGINVCGEGGEYETFTLDCPLFRKEIVIDSSEVCVHSDDAFAPVAYLKLTAMHLRDKTNAVAERRLVPYSPNLLVAPVCLEATTLRQRDLCLTRGGYVWIMLEGEGEDAVAEQTKQLFSRLQGHLDKCGCGWSDVVLLYLYLSDMADYSHINAIYLQHFPTRPPARVCIQSLLSVGVRVKVELLVCQGSVEDRRPMHVQSVSHWAPANIGPYSQAYTVGEVVYTAGQIGLAPGRMELVGEGEQPSLALTHVLTVLRACHAHLDSTLWGLCYFTSEEAGWVAKATWSQYVRGSGGCGCPVAFVHVPGLPRRASTEWHFAATKTTHPVSYSCRSWIEDSVGVVTVSHAHCSELDIGCWMAVVAPLPTSIPTLHTAIKSSLQSLQVSLSRHNLTFADMTIIRVIVPKYGHEMVPTLEAVLVEWGDGSSLPLSLLQSEGCYSVGAPLTVQACRLHRAACGEIGQAQAD